LRDAGFTGWEGVSKLHRLVLWRHADHKPARLDSGSLLSKKQVRNLR
jgi:hypothetical protein